MFECDYDEKHDILYIAIGDKSNSYMDEHYGDVLVARDYETDVVTGFTIFNFLKRLKENCT